MKTKYYGHKKYNLLTPYLLFFVAIFYCSCAETESQANVYLTDPTPCMEFQKPDLGVSYFPTIVISPSTSLHIFTCIIDTTYRQGDEQFSLGIVKDRFHKVNVDTVLIQRTFRNTEWPVLKTEYLVVGRQDSDSIYRLSGYGSTSDTPYLFLRLEEETKTEEGLVANEYFNMIKEYSKLRKVEHTGKVTLELCGNKVAEGHLLNGKLDGQWLIYQYNKFTSDIVKNELSFKEDLLDGQSKSYNFHKKGKYIIGTSFCKKGELVWSQQKRNISDPEDKFIVKKEFITTEKQKDFKKTTTTSSGEVVLRETFGNFPGFYAGRERIFATHIQEKEASANHGDYFKLHKAGKRSSEKGQYFRGAKVGTWLLLDDSGNESTKVYEFPDTTIADFVSFYHNGNPRITGQIINGKQEGLWSFYNGTELYEQVHYKDGLWHGRYTNYQKGKPFTMVEYIRGKKEGAENIFLNDNKVITKNYQNGKLHGEEVTTIKTEVGNVVEKRVFYKNGLQDGKSITYFAFNKGKFTALNGKVKSSKNYKKGLLHGSFVEYASNEGKALLTAGNYWYGLKNGVWKHDQNKKTSYSISYSLEKDKKTGQWVSIKGERTDDL